MEVELASLLWQQGARGVPRTLQEPVCSLLERSSSSSSVESSSSFSLDVIDRVVVSMNGALGSVSILSMMMPGRDDRWCGRKEKADIFVVATRAKFNKIGLVINNAKEDVLEGAIVIV